MDIIATYEWDKVLLEIRGHTLVLRTSSSVHIPPRNLEPSLSDAQHHVFIDRYVDDDCGGAAKAEDLVDYLHHHYFPRLSWVKLTLNPKK